MKRQCFLVNQTVIKDVVNVSDSNAFEEGR